MKLRIAKKVYAKGAWVRLYNGRTKLRAAIRLDKWERKERRGITYYPPGACHKNVK